MLIEAAAPFLRRNEVHLEIIGDGPQRPRLEQLARELALTDNLRLSGWIDHREVPKRLVDADLFVLPSIREFGGGAVLEAMAVGLPAAVVAYGGPGELVDESVGFALRMGTRTEIIGQLSDLFAKLVASPAQLDVKGAAAKALVVRKFTWDAKARDVVQEYHRVLLPAFDESAALSF